MNDEDRVIRAWLARGANVCRALVAQRREMDAYVIGGAPQGDVTGRRATKVWPDMPINAGPIDLMDEIDTTAGRYADLTRGTLRLGSIGPSRDASTCLGIVADHLPELNGADPDLTAEAISAIWDLHRKASRLVDPPRGLRPFRVDEPCPVCGYESLWFDPETWRIGCGMPSCRGMWGPDDPILRPD